MEAQPRSPTNLGGQLLRHPHTLTGPQARCRLLRHRAVGERPEDEVQASRRADQSNAGEDNDLRREDTAGVVQKVIEQVKVEEHLGLDEVDSRLGLALQEPQLPGSAGKWVDDSPTEQTPGLCPFGNRGQGVDNREAAVQNIPLLVSPDHQDPKRTEGRRPHHLLLLAQAVAVPAGQVDDWPEISAQAGGDRRQRRQPRAAHVVVGKTHHSDGGYQMVQRSFHTVQLGGPGHRQLGGSRGGREHVASNILTRQEMRSFILLADGGQGVTLSQLQAAEVPPLNSESGQIRTQIR